MSFLYLPIPLFCFALISCSSSSTGSNSNEAETTDAHNQITMRLLSESRSLADGRSSLTTYQYDEHGNLIGEITGAQVVTYNIEVDGRIIDRTATFDGVPAEAKLIYRYSTEFGLRRMDNLASTDGVTFIGVSSIHVYGFADGLATASESRRIPFEDIAPNIQVEDTAGILMSTTKFNYDGEQLVQADIDSNADGVVDTVRSYIYNSDGTLSSTSETGESGVSNVYIYEQGACNNNWGNSSHRYFCID